MLKVTENAAKKFRELFKGEGENNSVVRLYVSGFG